MRQDKKLKAKKQVLRRGMPPSLTPQEIAIIQKTWKIPALDLFDTGDVMLFKFFEKYPHYKVFFPKFRDTPLDQLKGSAAFRAHAYRIMTQFSATIDCLSQSGGTEEIGRLWRAHGELHHGLKVTKKQFLQIRDVIIGIILELCNLHEVIEVRETWEKLFDIVYAFSFEAWSPEMK